MPTVVCFGDSNTWGADPASPERFPPEVRWTGVVARTLGPSWRIIEEGLNGRTTNLDDPIEEHKNGLTYLHPCLESHRPFDAITIMLGTNDLKARFGRSASDIAQSAAALGRIARRSQCGPGGAAPQVLLIAPPPVVGSGPYTAMFAGAVEKSQQFGEHYRFFAEANDLHFLDAGSVITSSPVDGIHFDAAAHAALGAAIAQRLRSLLG